MAKLVDYSLRDFVRETASNSPAPGGGSCAALAGAEAAALARMVISLSLGKKAFLELEQEIQDAFIGKQEILQRLEDRLLYLVDEDTQAFLKLMSAFKLPKSEESEVKRRKTAIAEATITTASVPLATAQAVMEVLELLPLIARYGNRNCLSDIGTAALLADTALGGAHFNVLINLPGIKDEKFVKDARTQVELQKARGNELKDEVLAEVYAGLK
ncbi:MAG: cyclodeaminase/cyclohydrolase family protein [Eubacteriales bacterium]|nr:cyclodeaminase/cyclohydrolase family protein [Eubacteriales bacterium]